MKPQTLAVPADEGKGFEQYRKPTQRDMYLAMRAPIAPGQRVWRTVLF